MIRKKRVFNEIYLNKIDFEILRSVQENLIEFYKIQDDEDSNARGR
jgi:predicted solute-binding protein